MRTAGPWGRRHAAELFGGSRRWRPDPSVPALTTGFDAGETPRHDLPGPGSHHGEARHDLEQRNVASRVRGRCRHRGRSADPQTAARSVRRRVARSRGTPPSRRAPRRGSVRSPRKAELQRESVRSAGVRARRDDQGVQVRQSLRLSRRRHRQGDRQASWRGRKERAPRRGIGRDPRRGWDGLREQQR